MLVIPLKVCLLWHVYVVCSAGVRVSMCVPVPVYCVLCTRSIIEINSRVTKTKHIDKNNSHFKKTVALLNCIISYLTSILLLV